MVPVLDKIRSDKILFIMLCKAAGPKYKFMLQQKKSERCRKTYKS